MPLNIAFILLFMIPSLCFAWSGKVVGVADGDTIKVEQQNGKNVNVRLYGIDTPEKKQAYGNQAKKKTNSLVRGRTVEVRPLDTDRYGRTVAMVYVNGQSLNQHLVQEGYAWVYTKYCRETICSVWKGIETFARLQGRGMWADPDIIPPWKWRKAKRENGQKR